MAAETPAIWLTQNCMRPNEFSSDFQPHLNQESETLTASLLDKVHTRLSLLLRILDDTSQPISLPKPWRKAMSIELNHVHLRADSLKQALSDLLPHLKEKNAPSIVIDPNAIEPDLQAPVIELDLRQIPLADVLRYIALQTRTDIIAKDDSLAFVSPFYWEQH